MLTGLVGGPVCKRRSITVTVCKLPVSFFQIRPVIARISDVSTRQKGLLIAARDKPQMSSLRVGTLNVGPQPQTVTWISHSK
jgi:hypothetical protein